MAQVNPLQRSIKSGSLWAEHKEQGQEWATQTGKRRSPASNILIPAAAGRSQPVTRSDMKLEKPLAAVWGMYWRDTSGLPASLLL